MWNDFFDIDLILSELEINHTVKDVVELGCGYGTFTIPAAKRIKGRLFAFDIEKEMIDILEQKVKQEQIRNIIPEQRDILSETTGLPDKSKDYVMLFNILHHETPNDFLNEAYRILKPKGKIGIIHWRSDILTPRGPELDIRPKPDQILQWIDIQQFSVYKEPFIIKPYHFGLIISKL
ncbi:aklanonic acid methyltransferase DnrC [mine drainage metagenome]|uniref:Aklanonic acid methyltransferase DnrC n=1 Tax=mine drainage metagenome TaxID=410659 RepID=A0A1J5SMP2_9ZZZZ